MLVYPDASVAVALVIQDAMTARADAFLRANTPVLAISDFALAECASALRAAEGFLRRLDLTLRTPDAVHVALARRIGASLASFDKKMAASARALGADLAPV